MLGAISDAYLYQSPERVLRQPGGAKLPPARPDGVQGALARAGASLEADLEQLAGERSTGARCARSNSVFDSKPASNINPSS